MSEETKDEVEVKEHIAYISGEYLSAACNMVAWQFIDGPQEYKKEDKEEFTKTAAEMLRQHCPLAYSYFFQNAVGNDVLPTGTIDIILSYIWKENPSFLGGKPGAGIYIP